MNDECYVFVRRMQERNVSPMPIIGVYVATASFACSYVVMFHLVAMIRNTPARYFLDVPHNLFGLNATWLTVLAVATKLTGDLTSLMWSPKDNAVKVTSTGFLTLAMNSSFTTLGCMNNTDLIQNLMALTILVFTMIGDLCIQLYTGVLDYSLFPEIIISLVLLFSMFILIVCSAVAVPAIKKRAELNYQKLASQMDLGQQHSTVEELRLSVTKYWVMATSGSPQLLFKRLVTFPLTNIICLLSATICLLQLQRTEYEYGKWKSSHCQQESDYKNSVDLIITYQFPIMVVSWELNFIFLLYVVIYKYGDSGIKISREDFSIEPYWTEKLVEWRQSSIPIWIKKLKLRKFIHNLKALIFTFCIRLQTVIVMWCKFCRVLSFYPLLPLVILIIHTQRLIDKNEQRRPEIDLDLNCFVILLEGEKQFPDCLLRMILRRVDRLVERGKKHRPQNLLNLLNQSYIFSGVVEFDDSNRVLSLLSGEPPNCWTLPVVTLTTIAIALPSVATQHVDELVSGVDQGLYYARLVDILDEKCKLKSITNAADFVWDGVAFHNKWLDIDLQRKAREVNSAKEIIQTLADVAEKIVVEFSSTQNTILVENPLYWPANVVAANSMYRISRTLLLLYENTECQAEELFRKLICMIADILAACLTNMPHVITTKCRCNAIEEREKSVHYAASLFGTIEDILKRFEERQLLSIGRPTQPLCIDEWRRYMERQLIPTIISASATTNNNGASSVESNEQMVVQMQV